MMAFAESWIAAWNRRGVETVSRTAGRQVKGEALYGAII
jgi:hypothetical protein